jgi:hypothetical protein
MTEKGPLARTELWSSLPKEEWDRATTSLVVDVEDLPSDPTVNRLAGHGKSDLYGIYGLMAFAAVFAIPGVLMAANGLFRLIVGTEKR